MMETAWRSCARARSRSTMCLRRPRQQKRPILRPRRRSDSFLGGFVGERLHPRVQAGFVARGGILVEHTLLHTLVERGNGLAILFGNRRGIALGNGLAEGAK